MGDAGDTDCDLLGIVWKKFGVEKKSDLIWS